ncbi:MAG: hypothetical protein V3V34_11815 [Kiloniellales bacterium]
MSSRFHDLGQITVKLGTFTFTEHAGDGILWAPIEDMIAKLQGARGAVMVSAKFDELSEITLNIMPGSPNMEIINAAQGQPGERVFLPLVAVDPNANSSVVAPSATLRRRPDWAKAEEAAAMPVIFDLFNARVDYGPGSVEV